MMTNSLLTYTLLNAVFLGVAVVLLVAGLLRSGRARQLVRAWWLPWLIAAIALFALTAVFDNVMIAAGLFEYGEGTAELRIGLVPIEDFAYPVGALLALPGLWLLVSPRDGRGRGARRIHSGVDAETERER